MLNWRIEEEKAEQEAVKKYLSRQKNIFELLFLTKKQEQKNINYIRENARNEYRIRKLDNYFDEVVKERKRIDKLVEQINEKTNTYLLDKKALIDSKVKPFKIKVREYNDVNALVEEPTEIISIYLEPFEIRFMQDRLGE